MMLKVWNGLLLLTLAFFSFLLYSIVAQYIPFQDNAAFLRIKIDEVQIPYYLFWFKVHVFSSGIVLLAGFTQFSGYIRKNYRKVHRTMGYIYSLTVLLLAAPSGIVIGYHALGGTVSAVAFIVLGLLWFAFTLLALMNARRRKWVPHRNFMIRSYALSLSAVSLRLFKLVIVAIWAPAPMDVYLFVAWLGWVINALVAEVIIKVKAR